MQAKYLGVAELFSEQTWQKIGTKIKKCSSLKTVSGLCVQSLLSSEGSWVGLRARWAAGGWGSPGSRAGAAQPHTSGKGPDRGLSAAPCCLRSAGATVMSNPLCRLHGTRPGNAPWVNFWGQPNCLKINVAVGEGQNCTWLKVPFQKFAVSP